MYERQAYLQADGTYLFWGGLHVGNVGGGEGLIEDHLRSLDGSVWTSATSTASWLFLSRTVPWPASVPRPAKVPWSCAPSR